MRQTPQRTRSAHRSGAAHWTAYRQAHNRAPPDDQLAALERAIKSKPAHTTAEARAIARQQLNKKTTATNAQTEQQAAFTRDDLLTVLKRVERRREWLAQLADLQQHKRPQQPEVHLLPARCASSL